MTWRGVERRGTSADSTEVRRQLYEHFDSKTDGLENGFNGMGKQQNLCRSVNDTKKAISHDMLQVFKSHTQVVAALAMPTSSPYMMHKIKLILDSSMRTCNRGSERSSSPSILDSNAPLPLTSRSLLLPGHHCRRIPLRQSRPPAKLAMSYFEKPQGLVEWANVKYVGCAEARPYGSG
jgi:hypothetical protein